MQPDIHFQSQYQVTYILNNYLQDKCCAFFKIKFLQENLLVFFEK